MTPGVRIVAIPAAALAAVAPRSFAVGLATGNAVFVTGHYALGALLGPPAVALAGSVGPALIAVVGGLAVVGLIGWLAIRRRPEGGGAAGIDVAGVPAAAGDWSDAACPACLLLGAGGRAPRSLIPTRARATLGDTGASQDARMEARIVSLPTRTEPAVRIDPDRIVVDHLVVSDAGLASWLGEQPMDDHAILVDRALRIGLTALQSVGVTLNVDAVRAEFDRFAEGHRA